MKVHLVNPSDRSFGVGVITPRWLFVLAAATPRSYGDPAVVDESEVASGANRHTSSSANAATKTHLPSDWGLPAANSSPAASRMETSSFMMSIPYPESSTQVLADVLRRTVL